MVYLNVYIFQSDIKLDATFTEDLNDPTSSEFISLATSVEVALLPELQNSIPTITAVVVTGFTEGSVIAAYNMYITDPAGASVSADDVGSAVAIAVSTVTIPGVPVDTSYIPQVQGWIFILKL